MNDEKLWSAPTVRNLKIGVSENMRDSAGLARVDEVMRFGTMNGEKVRKTH